ncbi:MAG: hypothetical protein PHN57_05590, partial [Candidatus Omnitrophica bacterium]|nr:hypothetical protein [Candidatus Omnitrophota bacterium]
GLISVIFISTISITQSLTEREFIEHKKSRFKRFRYLPLFIFVSIMAIILYFWKDAKLALPPLKTEADIRSVLWNTRQLDLLGQVGILLAGAIGVIIFFKRAKQNE